MRDTEAEQAILNTAYRMHASGSKTFKTRTLADRVNVELSKASIFETDRVTPQRIGVIFRKQPNIFEKISGKNWGVNWNLLNAYIKKAHPELYEKYIAPHGD